MPLLARRAASATERTLVYFRMNMYIRPLIRLSASPQGIKPYRAVAGLGPTSEMGQKRRKAEVRTKVVNRFSRLWNSAKACGAAQKGRERPPVCGRFPAPLLPKVAKSQLVELDRPER